MPFELFTYRRVDDLRPALRGLPPVRGRVFLVAASGDRELLEHLLDGGVGRNPDCQVRRWDEIYRFFTEELDVKNPRVQIDPPDHWLLLHAIMERFRASGGELPPGAQRRGFLSLLGTQIRELIREEIAPEVLEQVYGDDDVLGHAFIRLYRAYLDALDSRGLSDSAGVTTETRRLLDLPGAAEVCRKLDLALVGFSSFTHSQLALLRALVGAGASVRVFAPVAGSAGAYGASQQFGVDGVSLSRAQPFEAVVMEGGDPRQELEHAARSLVLWEQGAGHLAELGKWPGWDGIAFSVPRARMAEAREVLSRYGVPCAWDFRLKVTETPLWALVSSCLEAASGGWQTEPVLRLLSEPWLCGFSLDVSQLRKRHPRGIRGWRAVLEGADAEAFERCTAFAAAVAGGGRAIELLTALRTFAGRSALSVSALIREAPELDERVGLFAEALRELDRKILFIREVVRDLGEFGEQKLTGADARAYLAAWAEGTTVAQQQPESGCMTVFADSPPTLFSSPCFFLFGAESSQWPGSLKESPVLDEARKTKLHEAGELGLDRSHLPLLSEQRAQREFLFRRLIACGNRLTFVCHSAADAQDRPQEMTPFFQSAQRGGWIGSEPRQIVRRLDGILDAPDEEALVPVESRRPDLRTENTLPAVRTRPGLLSVRGTRASFSSIDDYAGCPYFFAMRHLLRLPEPPREGEYDVLRGGTAVHLLWEHVWQVYAASGAQSGIAVLAQGFFDEALEAAYPELLRSPSLRRDLASLRWRVERCAQKQDELEVFLRPLRESVECELELPPLAVSGVTFSGRCDRLDRLRDGRFLLWDYKAGRSENYKKALQLAGYALALEQNGSSCAGWGYFGLRDGGVAGLWRDDLRSALSLPASRTMSVEGQMDAASELLSALAGSLSTGQFVPLYESDSCRVCSFAALCRRGEFRGELEEENDDE
ncbi:MAG: PD-(D/E)XK nuclease family protein [Pyramidobacter sp.]|nr:PD-(D/E)XK nuclease family protein [Pyramidobacter sp.]